MNTTQILSDALFAEPDDFTLAAALVEHLVCDCDWHQTEADKKVDDLITRGRYARDLVTAAELMSDDGADRNNIIGVLCSVTQAWNLTPLTVFLVPGEQPPMLTEGEGIVRRRKRTVYSITVGATRVLRIAHAHDVHKHPPRLGVEVLIP